MKFLIKCLFLFCWIDSGLVVPCTTAELRGQMQETMDKMGIGVERRSESIARAVAEVALHFLGGPHRFTPKNSHQKPVVVVMCGNHPEASGAVCAARHLATLGVRTIVFLQSPTVPNYLVKEIELYKLTGQTVINNEKSNLFHLFFADLIFVYIMRLFEYFRTACGFGGFDNCLPASSHFSRRRQSSEYGWNYRMGQQAAGPYNVHRSAPVLRHQEISLAGRQVHSIGRPSLSVRR